MAHKCQNAFVWKGIDILKAVYNIYNIFIYENLFHKFIYFHLFIPY